LIRNRPAPLALIALLALAAQLLVACGGPATPAATGSPPGATAGATSPAATTSAAGRAAPGLALRIARQPGKVFDLAELTIETGVAATNPFDPAQVDLKVRFTSPSNQVVVAPAFSYQDFDPATLEPKGAPNWRVRFTPSEPGRWQARAELAAPALKSEPVTFDVTPNPDAHGFVRIDKQNPRYFAFDDGTFFFPIGLNLGWSTAPPAGVLKDYERWLDKLSQNGGNVARVWMASWSFGIEWKDTGLGDYAARMKQAWLLDQVFAMAEQRHVYLMLTLLNHGAFSTSVNPEWKDNPYNTANGGPLTDPRGFATDPRAKELFKRRMRYIAARWGYATNLLAWEWWNEVNWTPIDDIVLKPWIAEMTAYLRQYDPYQHLVSNSHAHGETTRLWKMPELSFAQQHDYSGRDPVKMLPFSFELLAQTAGAKPVLLAEYGYSGEGAKPPLFRETIQFHNGLWAAPFSGFAGSAMYWWWDTLVDPQNLWPEYKSIAEFLKDENLATLAPTPGKIEPAGATALGLQGRDRALVWVRGDAYDVAPATSAYDAAGGANGAGAGWTYRPPTVSGLKLTLSGLADGVYSARWFSPETAAWQPEQRLEVKGGTATLEVPAFTQDLAVKVVAAQARQ
jgi:hypothetical protein